jgi:hypothetical protein
MVAARLLLVTSMAAETTCGSELTQLVAYHVLSNVNRDKFVTVMNSYSVSHEIRGDH